MPAFGEMLAPEEIDEPDAIRAVALRPGNRHRRSPRGAQPLFLDNCASCHGEDGTGGREFGAPSLADGIWLYGGDAASIHTSITNARYGVMPGFGGRLRPEDIAKVAVYVHTLGGGE